MFFRLVIGMKFVIFFFFYNVLVIFFLFTWFLFIIKFWFNLYVSSFGLLFGGGMLFNMLWILLYLCIIVEKLLK